jgi:hypothetical protein
VSERRSPSNAILTMTVFNMDCPLCDERQALSRSRGRD